MPELQACTTIPSKSFFVVVVLNGEERKKKSPSGINIAYLGLVLIMVLIC
jgi:hypothetical protein